MAICKSLLLVFLLFFSQTLARKHNPFVKLSSNFSISFPLTSHHFSSSLKDNSLSSSLSSRPNFKSQAYNYKSSFKYSMALIVSLPIGTPPQTQQMVLDTGSQLSWIQCRNKPSPVKPRTTSFDPLLSSSFSTLPCNHPVCKPRIPDFTLPTSCDQNRLCHYSYFYADGTLAEGNLVKEKFTFSKSQISPPFILGCGEGSQDNEGILGMNLGRLSFASQAKLSKFSYCVPSRVSKPGITPAGQLYFGQNPNSGGLRYVDLLTFRQSQRSPNFDLLAYTIGLQGIRINGRRLNIPGSVFRPDASGSGQTIIDSGTEYTLLVDAAYSKVREEIVRLVGPKMKNGYVYGGALDMCFDAREAGIEHLIGDMVLELEKGVEIVVETGRMLAEVGGGVRCVGIGRSDMLGVASNIIGNFHQQNLWVEFDLANRRVGFGKADCSRS